MGYFALKFSKVAAYGGSAPRHPGLRQLGGFTSRLPLPPAAGDSNPGSPC